MSRKLDKQIEKSKQGLYKNKAIEVAMRELANEHIGGVFCENEISLQNNKDSVGQGE